MLNLEVAGLNQEFSFEDGSVTNFVSLRMPDGSIVRAIVTDEGARLLVEARAAMGGLASPQRPSPRPQAATPRPSAEPEQVAEPQGDEEGAVIFGGDDEEGSDEPWLPAGFIPPGAESTMPATPPAEHRDADAQAKQYRQAQSEQKKAQKRGPSFGRTVPKDDLGYPRPANGGTDPHDVMGGGGVTDEDGVGSI